VAHGRLSLRAATPADDPFLLEVYASTRASELDPVPWTAEQKGGFIRSQFDAQALAYRANYPGARFLVVEHDGIPVGRLYRWLDRDAGDLRIMDIALLPEHCGQGIGSEILGDVLAEADAEGLRVSLHVEEWNPAVRLYRRLGFATVGRVGIYDRMERPPCPPVS
jgi:ribosomal protein S18 acetylase RimI-like enzyme